MKLDFGFGAGTQSVLVPDSNLVGVLQAAPVQRMGSEEDELKTCAAQPGWHSDHSGAVPSRGYCGYHNERRNPAHAYRKGHAPAVG